MRAFSFSRSPYNVQRGCSSRVNTSDGTDSRNSTGRCKKQPEGETYGFAAARLTLGAGTSQRTSGPKLGNCEQKRRQVGEKHTVQTHGQGPWHGSGGGSH